MGKVTGQVHITGPLTPERWQELHDEGFTVVVNLQAESQDRFGDMPPDAYLWLPVVDFHDPTPEQMLLGARFINAAVKAGKKVVLHCKMGIGRSPMLAAAYLVTTGMGVEEALEQVKKSQLFFRPAGLQRARLEEFAKLWAEQATQTD